MFHQLKIKKEYMDLLFDNKKNFEVRKNDRDFKEGDYLALNEIDDEGNYTGACTLAKVIGVFLDAEYIKENYAVLTIKPCQVVVANDYCNYKPRRERKNENDRSNRHM